MNFLPPGSVVADVDASQPSRVIGNMEHKLGQPAIMAFLAGVISPWFADRIVDRFAYEGDASVGGPWPPLAESTIRLKRALGFPEEPNERTSEMMAHLAYDHGVHPWALGAELVIPEGTDDILRKKLETAQHGEPAGRNPLTGGATPARPVLGIGPVEEAFVAVALDKFLSQDGDDIQVGGSLKTRKL